jgi:hypothetical protein
LNAPGPEVWSIKDHLAHISAWEQFMLSCYLQGRPAHEAMQVDEATWKTLDENGVNAILYERSHSRPLPEVLAERDHSHAQVVAALDQVPFADLMKPLRADDPQARPVMGWVIGNTFEHYREHRGYIEALLKQRG